MATRFLEQRDCLVIRDTIFILGLVVLTSLPLKSFSGSKYPFNCRPNPEAKGQSPLCHGAHYFKCSSGENRFSAVVKIDVISSERMDSRKYLADASVTFADGEKANARARKSRFFYNSLPYLRDWSQSGRLLSEMRSFGVKPKNSIEKGRLFFIPEIDREIPTGTEQFLILEIPHFIFDSPKLYYVLTAPNNDPRRWHSFKVVTPTTKANCRPI